MTIKRYITLVSAALLATTTQVWAEDLATWSEGATQEFKAEQCVTIPGTPGVSSACSPDTRVPYPCPTWNKPTKTCHKTVKGVCSPAVPGIPATKECASANLGKASVKADGALATTGSSVQVHNTVHSDLFGAQTHFTVSCEVKSDAKFKACVDLLHPTSVEVSSDSVSCNIADGLPSGDMPIAADFCMFVEAKGVATGKPSGSVGSQIAAQVGLGTQNVAGQKIDLGNQTWTETVFKMDF